MDLQSLYLLDPAPGLQAMFCRPGLDLVMKGLSLAGEGWALGLLGIGIAWTSNREVRRTARSAFQCIAILALVGVIVAAAKHLLDAPRPLLLLGPERVRVLLEPLRRMSFPSGHSASAAALAVWASRDSQGARRWPWVFAFLCGLSRVYVGAHWVTDVCAGWLLGGTVALVACRAWPRPRCAAAAVAAAGLAPGAGATPEG